MKRKKEFGDGVIFIITNHLWWFLLSNFYFWILNIPLIFVVSTMGLSGDYSVNLLLILSLLPVGPALTALFGVMGKLTREGDINVTKDFFKAYKVNFLEALLFWSIGVVIIFILWTDIKFLSDNGRLYYLEILLIAIIFVCLALIFYIFPILSRFYLKRKDVLKLSLIYLFKKVYIGIFSVAAIFVIWSTLSKINGAIIILFFASIIGYFVMYLEKGMLEEIEANLKVDDNFEERD